MAGTIPPSSPKPDSDELNEPCVSSCTGPTGTVRPPAVAPVTANERATEDNLSSPTPNLLPSASAPEAPEASPVPTPRIVPPVGSNGLTPLSGAPQQVRSAPTRTLAGGSVTRLTHETQPIVPAPSPLSTSAPTLVAPTSSPVVPSVSTIQPHSQTHMAMAGWTPPTNDSVVIRSQRGDYVVGGQVGAGNFGAVYECVGPFDQRYALKVLRPTDRRTERVRQEWSSEVRRLLQLRHPNVVYIHDAFEWEGTFCVALEWCDHTLHDMLEQALQEELTIELSRQMLAAVQYLHDWDLVHDDLHPGNVLIQQTDRPIVKISDFGISAELRGAPTVRPEIVHHAIMAPELIALGYTSKQSDLYQLGMIMYWMITGTPPMARNMPYEQLVQQISTGVARQKAEGLGTPLGNIVAKMLRRRDAYRYTSAREVWNDLRQLPVWQARQIFHVR